MLAKGAQTLPNKIAHDYKALAKFYDAKNYKKGLKNAQKILEQYPDHPETNSMKALFQLALGEENKAQVTAKTALVKSKMSSMFCWHTYGTIMKQKKNFAQASKCYQMALNFEKDNLQLLRQTASLQIQVRDHNSHVATRLKILQLKPNMMNNWVAFGVAHHLKGDFDQLFKALSSIDNLIHSNQMKPIQTSHYYVWRVIANNDAQKFDKMYEQLTKNKQKILDEDVWNQLMYKCCTKLNKKEQVQKHIQFLIKKYPQNLQYMRQYQNVVSLSQYELYKKIRLQFKSKIAKIYEICHIQNKQQFRKQFIEFIKPYFQKNLVSLFAQIQVIYQTNKFNEIIQQVFLGTQKSLRQNNKYLDGSQSQFPTQYLWSLYLLAQHFSRNFSTLKLAYENIIKAIEHTQTITQFYIIKAEIEYKMHNNIQALKTINQARKTDLADRYMNNICIKYLLKCMKPGLAEDILKLFMRDQSSLYELQNQWYIIQAGKSFLKQRNFPAGLRHLYFVEKQFQDIEANQYDFHAYCIRKWTIKEYLQYITFNDNIFKDKKYTQAAGCAIQYLIQYVHQLQTETNQPKQQNKQQEAAKKKKKKKKQKAGNQQQQLTPIQQFRKKIDYFGKQYSQKIKANPLDEAFIYAKNITSAKYVNKHNIKQNRLYSKAFSNSIKVFIHYNKPMLAIRAHKKLIKTQFDSCLNLFTTVKLINFLQQSLKNQKTQQLSKQFIKQYLNEILGESKTAEEYYKKNVESLPKLYNRQIKVAQIQLALKGQDSRDGFINLYKSELNKIMKSQVKDWNSLQLVFYLVHRLQFYGQFSKQMKDQLNKIFGEHTTYFTDWFEAIDKLPLSTWGIFWLSDYDIKREEEGHLDDGPQSKQLKEIVKPKQGEANNVQHKQNA